MLEAETQPVDTMVRTFSPESGAAAGLLHQVETYATPEEAVAAYAARAEQLGTCERNTAWVQAGAQVTGLSDEATGSTLVLQGETPEDVPSPTFTLVQTYRDARGLDLPDPVVATWWAGRQTFTR